jgi:hypothetical protein
VRIRLSDFFAALDADHIHGPVCASPACNEPVRQRGARCLEHRGPWDRERRRLVERARRDRARQARVGELAPSAFEGSGHWTADDGPQCSTAPGPVDVVGLAPEANQGIPQVQRRWRTEKTPPLDGP